MNGGTLQGWAPEVAAAAWWRRRRRRRRRGDGEAQQDQEPEEGAGGGGAAGAAGLRHRPPLLRLPPRPGGQERAPAHPGRAQGDGALHRPGPQGAEKKLDERFRGRGRAAGGDAFFGLQQIHLQHQLQAVSAAWGPDADVQGDAVLADQGRGLVPQTAPHARAAVHPAPAAGAQQFRPPADPRQADGQHVPEHVSLHQRPQGQPQQHQEVFAHQLRRRDAAPGFPTLQREGGARGREQGPEEAAAGEIPQHEPLGGHQRAAGEVRAGPEGLGGAFLPAPTLLFLPGRDINLSESEAEQDGTHNTLELPQAYAGRGNMKAQQSAVRLTEIGPRMTLQLVKVEEGLAQGNVLFHSFIHKTEEEVQEILARKEAKLKLKTERRQQQEAAVERKRQQREAHREKSLAGIRRKRQQDGDSDAEDPGAPEQQDAAGQSDESDAEYYRQELGQEPDEDLFPNRAKRPRGPSGSAVPRKRRRRSQQEQPGAPKPRPVARKKGPARTDSKPQGAAGRKTGRGSERPAREGQKHGPKRRGKLLARGKIIFRRPGHGKKGKR